MEFEASLMGVNYRFSSLNKNSFLVSGPHGEYILYQQNHNWRCADELENLLLTGLGDIIDEHMHATH